MTAGLEKLLNVMASLRNHKSGCPWDLEQTFESLAPYLLEEAYEAVDAIERNDLAHLQEELGDVLLQVVFHSQIALEQGLFTFDDVASAIAQKMIDRHPHVFALDRAPDANAVVANWETSKETKRNADAAKHGRKASVLDDVSISLPAATRAVKLQKRAARVGFDWTNIEDVFSKIDEEIAELKVEIETKAAHTNLEDELGDILFAVTNLARKLDIDPETALRRTNAKFERRFQGIESALEAQKRTVQDASLEEMESIWIEIKKAEKH